MKKTIIFDGVLDIGNEQFLELFEVFDALEETKYQITFLFSSIGGTTTGEYWFVHYFNSLRNLNNITIIPGHFVGSAGLIFFLKAKCKKKYVIPTIGMAHLLNFDVSSRDNKDVYSYDYLQNKQVEADNKKELVWYEKIGITKQELEKIKRGRNFNFDLKRLKQLERNARKLDK